MTDCAPAEERRTGCALAAVARDWRRPRSRSSHRHPLAAGSLARTAAARRVAPGRAIDAEYFEPGACVEFAPDLGRPPPDRLPRRRPRRHRSGGRRRDRVGSRRSTRRTRRSRSSSNAMAPRGRRASPSWCRGPRPRRWSAHSPATSPAASSRSRACTTTWRPATCAPTTPRRTSSSASTSTPAARPQRRQRHGLRHRPTLRGAEPPPGHAGPERRARRHERPGLGHPRASGWSTTAELGGPGAQHRGGRLRPPAAARPGRPRLVHHAERDAGRADRAALHHRPLEGSIADSSSGQQVIAGGLAQAVEQYFAPRHGEELREGDPGTHHTEKDDQSAAGA